MIHLASAPALAALLVLASGGAGPGGDRPTGGAAQTGAAPRAPVASLADAGAAPRAPSPDSLAVLVERARSRSERGDHAGAADAWLAAAELAPEVAPWLRLSALQASARAGDARTVRRLAGELADAAVIPDDSVRLERARAAFLAGDPERGAELGAALEADADPALWAERVAPALLAAGDTARARRGLAGAAAEPGSPAGAGGLLLRLEPDWRELGRTARGDLRGGREVRGRRLLARALEAAPPSARPGLAEELAEAQMRAGRFGEAHRVAARWLGRGGLPGGARARLELLAAETHLRRGEREEAEEHYRRGAAADAGEPSARSALLLAYLAHGRGETAVARARYREAADLFPRSDHGGLARMRLGFLAFLEGDHDAAGAHFRLYRDAHPTGGDWTTASLYWEARARAATGDEPGARGLYRHVLRRDPLSWYGVRSAARLGEDVVAVAVPPSAGEGAGRRGGPSAPAGEGRADVPEGAELPPDVEDLLRRMRLLEELGWRPRALRELDHAAPARAVGGGLVGLARRLGREGWTGPGIRLGWRAFQRNRGRWTPELIRAVWPLPHDSAVVRAAESRGLPAALVAGLVRQESAFDPAAVSSAGAVGLMQLLPSTARRLARREGLVPPGSEDLKEPALNLELGTRYLAELMERFDGSRVGALVSYNAGPERWARWRSFPEAEVDPELLVERIPYVETRRYVKAVLRNAHLYARVYGLVDDPRGGALGS